MKAYRIIFAFMTVFLFIVVSICCGRNEPKLKSAWRDREITVDGKSAERSGEESEIWLRFQLVGR